MVFAAFHAGFVMQEKKKRGGIETTTMGNQNYETGPGQRNKGGKIRLKEVWEMFIIDFFSAKSAMVRTLLMVGIWLCPVNTSATIDRVELTV